jgi:hypothetical protein
VRQVYFLALQQPVGLVQGASNSTSNGCIYDPSRFVAILLIAYVLAVFLVEERPSFGKHREMPKISNSTLLTIFVFAVGVALAFFSFVQMSPYWINAVVYIVALAVIILCGKLANITWRPEGRALAVFGIATYCAFFGWATLSQYDNQHDIHLIFKPSVSEYRQFVTKNDLAEFRNYFRGLDVPTPADDPVIGIEINGNCSSFHNPQTHRSVLRREILIGEKCLTREEMTQSYSDFVIERLPQSKSLDNDINHLFPFMLAQATFSTYFNWSFWGNERTDFCPGGSTVGMGMYAPTLWKIRQKFGRDFTDRMVAFAARLTADDPLDGMDKDAGIYVARKLKEGDSVVDDKGNWSIILDILKSDGVKISDI